MNVLIYTGPEVLAEASKNTFSSLRAILRPHYSVQPLTPDALTTQPWKASCALFVLPRCNRSLDRKAASAIREYVEGGGSLLGFTSGAVGSSRAKTVGSASGDGEVGGGLLMELVDKAEGRFVYPTFGMEERKKGMFVRVEGEDKDQGIEVEGIPDAFVDVPQEDGSVLARFQAAPDSTSESPPAGIKFKISKGTAAFWAAYLEDPVKDSLQKPQLDLLKRTLLDLSLKIPEVEPETPITHPLPQFLTASKGEYVSRMMDALAAPSSGSQLSTFKDDNDTFNFYPAIEARRFMPAMRANAPSSNDPADWQPKAVILCPDGVPEKALTPLFDLEKYYEYLKEFRERQGLGKTREDIGGMGGLGEALLYGEVVTSTQTMLDKNPRFHTALPTPLVSLATYQLQGRGRGSNVWVSPTGCLQFSLLLRLDLSSFPASKLVFIQYLFALAVAEACRDDAVLGEKGGRVRLKWPNDVYAVGADGEERKKVGGILVGTSFGKGSVDVIIGCGLNVLNEEPIFSLSQLLAPEDRDKLTMEKTLACILIRFDQIWETFVAERGSFDSFMNLYLQRWLHSDELVTVTTVDPPQRVRIAGITRDHGLLHTILERDGWAVGAGDQFIDLQPDGNSFDMMQGLIKTKR